MNKKTIVTSRKAQVTMWIIIAIALVGAIVLFFSVQRGGISGISGKEISPKPYIEDCTRQAAGKALDLMILQGGFIEPKNYKIYNDTKVTYLCENIGYYYPCVQQHPMFLTEMQEELKTNITSTISACFDSLKTNLEGRGSRVELSPEMNVSVEFAPDEVLVNLDRKIVVTKNEETTKVENVKVVLRSPIYNLGRVAMDIAGSEAKFCYFEYVGYGVLYPRFTIKPFAMSDSTRIYTIIDTKTNKEMNIAIRGCAIPPGGM